ncbi:MAG: VOC family protein [Granulosicoccus sp.]
MQIKKIDHITIQTTQIEKMLSWYMQILGLRNGVRSDISSLCFRLYAGDTVVIHLVEIDGQPAVGSERKLKLEHFAFNALGAIDFEDKLNELQQKYRRFLHKDTDTVFYHIWDPDGNHIHVDFPAAELNHTAIQYEDNLASS